MTQRNRRRIATLTGTALIGLMTAVAIGQTDRWYPSRWGADDQRGAANRITPAKVLQAKQLITQGRMYSLGRVYEAGMPLPATRHYRLHIPQAYIAGGKNQGIYHDEVVSAEIGQVGTQFDGLGHFGIGDLFYNGNNGADYVHGGAGDDSVVSGGGDNDYVYGGAGNDYVDGGTGYSPYMIGGNDGYQFGIIQRGNGTMTVENCDFWGFGNAITLEGTGQKNIVRCWIHDAANGDVLWRRKDTSLDENDVAPVPGTDLVLLSFEKGERTRIEAVDVLSGDLFWQSEKLKGAVMQVAVETDSNLLAVVLARDAKGRASDGLKRHPMVHVLDLSTGDELWKREIESEVEMMPAACAFLAPL